MVKGGSGWPPPSATGAKGSGNVRLIVRWRTACTSKSSAENLAKRSNASRNDDDFCGLFIFDFDEAVRILNHVIEKEESGEGWDQGVGRVVGLTAWLLSRLGGRSEKEIAGLALGCYIEPPPGPGRRDPRRMR